jgi:hypothetical protein
MGIGDAFWAFPGFGGGSYAAVAAPAPKQLFGLVLDEQCKCYHNPDVYRLSVSFLGGVLLVLKALRKGSPDVAAQRRRAAMSISANIAEGAGEKEISDKRRGYSITRAQRSYNSLVTGAGAVPGAASDAYHPPETQKRRFLIEHRPRCRKAIGLKESGSHERNRLVCSGGPMALSLTLVPTAPWPPSTTTGRVRCARRFKTPTMMPPPTSTPPLGHERTRLSSMVCRQ